MAKDKFPLIDLGKLKFKGPLRTRTRKRRMLIWLAKAMGNVTQACTEAKMSRQTHFTWMKEDKVYADAANEVKEIALDFAEGKMFRLINRDFWPAIKHYLDTQGRGRGFGESSRMELSGMVEMGLPEVTFIVPPELKKKEGSASDSSQS